MSETRRWRTLRKGELLVVDDANFHAGEMAPFVALVSDDTDFTACTVPVGNGEYLATRTFPEPLRDPVSFSWRTINKLRLPVLSALCASAARNLDR